MSTSAPQNHHSQSSHNPHHQSPRHTSEAETDRIPKMYTHDEQEYPEDNDVKTFLSWHAPGRPFKKRSKEFFVNGFLIMMAVEIIIFLFGWYLLMLVVFSFVFLSYALALVPPRDFFYKMTSEGIRAAN